MTPVADVAFVAAVPELYLDLPDTPLRFNFRSSFGAETSPAAGLVAGH